MPYIVAHLVQLQIDFEVVIVKVLAQLGDDGAVCEGDELGIDFIYAGPCSRSASVKLKLSFVVTALGSLTSTP